MLLNEFKEKLFSYNIFENNEFFNLYAELIFKNFTTNRIKYETAKHHIIPVKYFKMNNLLVDNSKNNVINLLHKDHLKSHIYLALAIKDSEIELKYATVKAVDMCSGQYQWKTKLNNFKLNEIENLCMQYHNDLVKYKKNIPPEIKAKQKAACQRPEVREKISKTLTGRVQSEETKQKRLKTMSDPEYRKRHSEVHRGPHFSEAQFEADKRQSKILKEAYSTGKMVNWAKGKTAKDDPRIAKATMARANKIKELSKQGLFNNHSEESNKKISNTLIQKWKDPEFREYMKKITVWGHNTHKTIGIRNLKKYILDGYYPKELKEKLDNATQEEREQVIGMYLDSLDIKQKELDKQIEEDADLKQIADATKFMEKVQSGEVVQEI